MVTLTTVSCGVCSLLDFVDLPVLAARPELALSIDLLPQLVDSLLLVDDFPLQILSVL